VTDQEKAKIILKSLDKKMVINWNMEEHYLSAIIEGLREISKQED